MVSIASARPTLRRLREFLKAVNQERGAVFPVVIFGLVGLGLLTAPFAIGGSVLAASADQPIIIPIIGTSTAASAVAALVWIARKVLQGEVVPMNIKEITEEAVRQRNEAADFAVKLREENAELRHIISESNAALFSTRDFLLRNDPRLHGQSTPLTPPG